MRQMFIIAGGVLLALLAFVFIRALPGWLDEYNETQATYAFARSRTIEDVFAKCGTPTKDTTEDILKDGSFVWRTLTYVKDYNYEPVELKLLQTKDNTFSIWSIDDTKGQAKDVPQRAQLALLPCMR